MLSRASATFLVFGLACICSVKCKPVGSGGYQDPLQTLEYGAPYGHGGTSGSGYGNEPANYDFQYEVFGGGNFFGHQESRRDQKTNGKYHVLLPDGRRQVVTYIADETGYHPTITYELVGTPVDTTGNGDGGYASGGYGSGGYGAPVADNSVPPPNRYSSRIKRQHFSTQDLSDDVQIYNSETNPEQRFRNRRRRFTPKKAYIIVYPDRLAGSQTVKPEP